MTRNGISTAPKNYLSFRKSVNKILFRKHGTTRVALGVDISAYKAAYKAGKSPFAYADSLVGK